ncbi:MAG: arginine deiminase family protein [Myxococcota bacterium]
MKIGVHSEIGALRRVLVHRPAAEIVRMTQHDLDRMLFDDILAPDETAAEHDVMTQILRESGAEVLYVQELLHEALQAAPADDRRAFVEGACALCGLTGVAEELAQWPADRLARGLIAGIYWRELDAGSSTLARIRATRLPGSDSAFAMPPAPNLMFMRDPCMSVFDRVVMGRMATAARAREPLLVAFALQHAPSAGAQLSFAGTDARRSERFAKLEGGDVLVLCPEALMIGCSLRTSAATLERLAHDALFGAHPALQRVLVVFMPEARSVMHLDTILTQVDRELFLGHRPLIMGGPGREALAVAEVRRDGPPRLLPDATVLDVLRETLGAGVAIVPCGGQDPLHQEREQWTDGANAVAVAPGHIVLYARNARTTRALAEHGFSEVRLSAVQSVAERADIIAQGTAQARTVYSFSGSELSRARGGGRCLTMPLLRDELNAG